MSLIDLYPAFYCLYIKDYKGEEQMFLQKDISPNSNLHRLDLFENEETLHHWIKEEQEIQAQKNLWSMHGIYDRLYSKKLSILEFPELMKERKEIDSVTLVDKSGLRRLYFRYDLEHDYDFFPISRQKLYPKEPIYIINRQRKLDEQVILQKEPYFVTYPEIGTPLFSVGISEWADELISRKANQGYYIEQTSLYDIYYRTKLNSKDSSLFILTREEAPHYILRQNNLKMIVEEVLDHQY
jgi:hypothetical protein